MPAREDADRLPGVAGRCAVLAGSCSRATLAQIGVAREQMPTLELDALASPDAAALVAKATSWLNQQDDSAPLLIAASAPPDQVAALQARLGREAAGTMIETVLAAIAEQLVAHGVRRLVVAGGETSGAVVTRLGLRRLRIGPQIDPGVPWTFAEGDAGPPMLLALKSGNFGRPDFFPRSFAVLDGNAP